MLEKALFLSGKAKEAIFFRLASFLTMAKRN